MPLNWGLRTIVFIHSLPAISWKEEKILNWLISGMQQAPNSLSQMFYFDKKGN
jgi:hypothetical protein